MTEQQHIQVHNFPVLRFALLLTLSVHVVLQLLLYVVFAERTLQAALVDLCISLPVGVFFVYLIYFFICTTRSLQRPAGLLPYLLEWLAVLTLCVVALFGLRMLLEGRYIAPVQLLQQVSFRLHLCINAVMISFTYLLITVFTFYEEIDKEQAHREQLEKEFAGVRLQALRSQINPHFLFNSLSVLSTLVHTDPLASEKFIEKLAKAYRYILEQKDTALIALDEELSFLDAYFFLLQIRFGNKIRLEKNITCNTGAYLLPPLTLQLLLENAVKHNSMSASAPLLITLQATDAYVEMRNNINLRQNAEAGTGIGLENIRRRMALLGAGEPIVNNNGNEFSVRIPLLPNALQKR